MQKISATLLFSTLFFLVTPIVFAQQAVTADQVNEIAKGLYCPVCESEPLDTCGTQACIDWREEIRAQLEAGRTDEQIYADFVARYGERVLAQPSSSGLNLLLWLGIPLGLIIGGYFFFVYLRRISLQQTVTNNPLPVTRNSQLATDEDDVYLRRIEEELAE